MTKSMKIPSKLSRGYKALSTIAEEDFQAISSYYAGNTDVKLKEYQKEMLERWQVAHALLRKYPRKNICASVLRARFPNLSLYQAKCDINNAIKFWNKNEQIDREFIEKWFVDRLLSELSSPNASKECTAKNLATLQKYLATAPPIEIDPKLMEKNQIYIQFNFNGQIQNFAEKDLMKIPIEKREKLLANIPHEITDIEAEEIINS